MFKLTRVKLLLSILVIFILEIYLLNFQNKNISLNIHGPKVKLEFLNPHDFNYILNPEYSICETGGNVTLLAMVPISPHNFLNRVIIRTTWANKNLAQGLRVLFVVGKSSNETINKKLKEEYQIYGDIIQEDFADTYKNLTLKTIMSIKWASTYCSNAKYLLKIDDDMIVNAPKLVKWLETNTYSNTFLCNPLWKSEVIRDNTSKFYMSKQDYYEDTYGTYCDGPAYLFSGDLISKLYNASLYKKNFVFEDVYIGMLAHQLNSTFDSDFSWSYAYLSHDNLINTTHRDLDDYFIVYTDYYIDIVIIWDLMQRRYYELLFNINFYDLDF